MKLLLLAILVGIVSGVGAMVFYWACQTVSHFSLAMIAGYQQSAPGGEAVVLGDDRPPDPVAACGPADGWGAVQRADCIHAGAGGGRPRNGRGD